MWCMSEAEPTAAKIDTRPVTVELSGPGVTPDMVYDLWERVYTRLGLADRANVEAGGMGFSAELDPERY